MRLIVVAIFVVISLQSAMPQDKALVDSLYSELPPDWPKVEANESALIVLEAVADAYSAVSIAKDSEYSALMAGASNINDFRLTDPVPIDTFRTGRRMPKKSG